LISRINVAVFRPWAEKRWFSNFIYNIYMRIKLIYFLALI
jgi:hypothetical protein